MHDANYVSAIIDFPVHIIELDLILSYTQSKLAAGNF